MARTPRTTRQTQADPDAFDDAVAADAETIADQLTAVMEGLGDFDQSSIKGLLYKVPERQGQFLWIRDIYPPFDVSEIMQSLKDEFGGGVFQLRIRAGGKIRKVIELPILKDPLWKPPGQRRDEGDSTMRDLLPLLLGQQNQSKTDMMTMMTAMMQQQQQSMTLMMQAGQQQTQMMVGMMTAAMGGREKLSDLIAATNALGGKKDGMGETLEMIKSVKGLFAPTEGAGGGFDPEDLIGSAVKLVGPVVASIGETMRNRRAAPAEVQAVTYVDNPGDPPAGTVRMIGSTDGTPAATVSAPNGMPPVLAVIAEDIAYLFRKRVNPDLAAEMIMDALEASDIDEAELDALVATYAVQPDWLAALAADGVDLRADPQWAGDLLNALIALRTGQGDDDTERSGGGERDASPDGAARMEGAVRPEGTGQGS